MPSDRLTADQLVALGQMRAAIQLVEVWAQPGAGFDRRRLADAAGKLTRGAQRFEATLTEGEE